MSQELKELRRDLLLASISMAMFGEITGPVRIGLQRWFLDVDSELVYPLAEMPMTAAERTKLTATVILEMLVAVDDVCRLNLPASEALERLSSVFDPLCREFVGLCAPVLNDEWRSNLPVDEEDRRVRVAILEQLTGKSRVEIADGITANPPNRHLRSRVSRLGLTVEDLC